MKQKEQENAPLRFSWHSLFPQVKTTPEIVSLPQGAGNT
jgi:hypothetical protein